MNRRILALLGSSLVFAITPTYGVDGPWPQWRGPNRTDVSDESGLLKTWPEGGPTRLWLFDKTGLGYSGPAIVGDRLFIMGARDDREWLIAIDVKSGTELWAAELGPMFENDYGDGPRGTPTVDGNRVYAMGGQGNLICAGTDDGKVRWKLSMDDLGGKTPDWGYSESVLVDGNQVVCTPGGPQGALAALDKMTGDVIWRSVDLTDGAQYASIIVAEHNGGRQYIQLTMKHVVGISPEDGRVLWTSTWPGRTAVIPTPIYHDGHVYVTSGYGVGCKLIKLEPDGQATEVYANRTMKNLHGGVILVGDYLYGYSEGLGWLCQNFFTGKQIWNERRQLRSGAVAYADGMLYCVSEREGDVVLAEASPDGWKECGRFTLEPQTKLRKPSGKIWTHPVIADGRLYLRDQELLFCFDVKR